MTESNTFEEEFSKLFNQAFDLLVDRQAKYGNVNIQQLGLHGVLSRIANDKVSRVMKNLNGTIVDGKVLLDPIKENHADEAFEDALFDIANYALIAIALKRGTWGKPLEGKTRWEMSRTQSPDTKLYTLASTARNGLRSSGIRERSELRAAQTERISTRLSRHVKS